MATIQDILNRVDDQKPNAFDEQTKFEWLSELEGRIQLEVQLLDIEQVRQLQYKYPEDLTTQVSVGYPFEQLYALYLGAMIDFHNGEYDQYENSMAMFNGLYSQFRLWFVRTYEPAQGYKGGYCSGGI